MTEDTLLERTKRKFTNHPVGVLLVLLTMVSVPIATVLQAYYASRQQPAPGVSDPAAGVGAQPFRDEPAAQDRAAEPVAPAPDPAVTTIDPPAPTPSRPAADPASAAPERAGGSTFRKLPDPPDSFAIPDGRPADRTMQPAYPP
ncbi:MAG TPA: hypothetical protein VFR81_14435 [Longimicrobium sp.]|nr:hypothetical protein [Longimicrobium sp.]